jgi:soluble lytic murein transglycosylase-like protein
MPYLPRHSGYAQRAFRVRGMGQALTSVQQQIISAAESVGLDPALALAVAQQESGFNQNAVSSAGATGVFQLMPATAAGLGVDASDLSDNIQGGVTYLAQLLQQYGGDVTSALWAYNAGPGNEAAGVLPSQTAAYIPAVQNLQSTWDSVLGTSSGTSSDSTDSSDLASIEVSSLSSASIDPTTLYIGLGLAGLALALFLFNSQR